MSTDSAVQMPCCCIRTPCRRRQEVWDWADSLGITIHYQGSGVAESEISYDIWDEWKIPGEQDRLLFSLKWG